MLGDNVRELERYVSSQWREAMSSQSLSGVHSACTRSAYEANMNAGPDQWDIPSRRSARRNELQSILHGHQVTGESQSSEEMPLHRQLSGRREGRVSRLSCICVSRLNDLTKAASLAVRSPIATAGMDGGRVS